MSDTAVSWSGGKDSALALDRAVRAGARIGALFTMFTEGGERSRSHGLPIEVLRAQAAALSVPLVARSATWAGYEDAFVDGLEELNALGVRDVVFGDIDIEDHRAWCVRAAQRAGVRALHPLWKAQRRALLDELFERGWKARIIVVREGVLPRDFLGRTLDPAVVADLERAGADACGENGEYHSVVVDGPAFAEPLQLVQRAVHDFGGCSFLDVGLAAATSIPCQGQLRQVRGRDSGIVPGATAAGPTGWRSGVLGPNLSESFQAPYRQVRE